MTTVYDVQPNALIARVKEKLKDVKEVKKPIWADFVKTGINRERQPSQTDWWYIRAAAILRTVYCRGPIGVQRLRVKFGGNQRRGHAPRHFAKGSGNISRKILQQLESAQLIKKSESPKIKGRVITPKGKQFLDKTASEMAKESKK